MRKKPGPRSRDASRVPLSQRADPVAECALAEVATGFDLTRDKIGVPGLGLSQ